MMNIVETNPQQDTFKQFIAFPKEIYLPDSGKAGLSESIPEEFLDACYLLFEGENVVARASLYNNPSLRYQDMHAWTIGNYECVDDDQYAFEILAHLIREAKRKTAGYLIGPMNGSTWENYRFGIDHRNPPFFLEPFQPLYYNDQFRDAGFAQIAHYYTNIDRHFKYDHPDVLKRERELLSDGVRIRAIDPENFEEEIAGIYDFTERAFKTNFLYTPIRQEAFLKKYVQARHLIDPDFTLLAEDSLGNLIGFYFCIHDFLNQNEKSLIVKTLARHPDPKWKGLGHVMGNAVYRKAAARGYQSALHSFIYQQGTSKTLSENFSGINYKNYALYGRSI